MKLIKTVTARPLPSAICTSFFLVCSFSQYLLPKAFLIFHTFWSWNYRIRVFTEREREMSSPKKDQNNKGFFAAMSSGLSVFGNAMHRSVGGLAFISFSITPPSFCSIQSLCSILHALGVVESLIVLFLCRCTLYQLLIWIGIRLELWHFNLACLWSDSKCVCFLTRLCTCIHGCDLLGFSGFSLATFVCELCEGELCFRFAWFDKWFCDKDANSGFRKV